MSPEAGAPRAEIPELDELVEMLSGLDRSGRIEALIALAEGYREVPARLATRPFPEANKVPACESQVYVFTQPRVDGSLDFYFAVENPQGISAKALADWNQLGSDMAVREGQTLIIPIATAAAPDPEPVPTAPGAGSPTPEPPSAKTPLPDEKTEASGTKPKGTPASPDLGAEKTKPSKMAMPASGKIIRGYDAKKNQGIDIAAAAGSSVKAADTGTVTVLSADTNGKGIVIIRHAGDLLTVYVGVSGMVVKKGDKVKRGQEIGKVAAGNPAFVHFEVRNTSKQSFDPVGYLQ